MTNTRTMIAALMALAGTCAAQTCDWNAASGNWSNPANWNPQNVPDNSSESARIAIGGLYTVTLDMSPTIAWLDISNPDATLHLPSVVLTLLNPAGLTNDGTVYGYSDATIAGNVTNNGLIRVRAYNQYLQLAGPTVTNHGVMIVNPEHSGYTGTLRFSGDTALQGSGYLRLDWPSAYLSTTSGRTLTQQPGHAINGRGEVHARLVNNGVVEADVAGATLELNTDPKINNAAMRATDGAILLAGNVSIDQTGGGTMLAEDGSVVRLTDATITGGSLDSEGDGYVEHRGGNSTLNGVTNQGLFNLIGYNLYTYIGAGGLHNNGSIVVNSDQSGWFADVRYTQSGVLNGNGTMTLNAGSASLSAPDGITVTHGAGHTIDGGGRVSASLDNSGAVRANRPGIELLLDTYPKTNRADMLASDGATLRVRGAQVTQTGAGVCRAEDASRVVLQDALIIGGTLDSAGSGYVEARDGHSTLRGVTNNGVLLLKGYNLYTYVDGEGLHNNGTIVVDYDLNGYYASLYYTQSGVLDGVGTLTMAYPSARMESADGVVVSHGPMHTIHGGGSLQAMIDNQGLIVATIPDDELILEARAKTNRASMLAADGATMRIRGIELDQAPGALIAAEDASRVVLADALIVGGTLDSAGSGYIQTRDGNSTLRDVTNEGRLMLYGYNHYTYVEGAGLINNGEIVVNHNQSGYFAALRFTDNGELDGSGAVTLRNGSSYLQTAAGVTLTNGPAHTIRGRGVATVNMVNNGLVNANDADGELLVNGDGVLNQRTMKASDAGTLRVSAPVNQTGAGVIRAEDASRAYLTNAHITGGRLETVADGYIETRDGESTLESLTNAGLLRLHAYNDYTYVVGDLTNDGQIIVNYNASGFYSVLYFTPNATLDGLGTVTLYGSSGSTFLRAADGWTATIGHAQTVAGQGTIYGSWRNHGTLAPGLPLGAMRATGALQMETDSTLAVDIESTTSYDRLDGTAAITAGGALDVSFVGRYTPQLWDEFTVLRGQSVTGEFDAITGEPLPGEWVFKVRYEPARAVLIITCPPDTNADGAVNTLDFLHYLNLWTSGDPEADWDHNGVVNTIDFLAYLNAWVAGC